MHGLYSTREPVHPWRDFLMLSDASGNRNRLQRARNNYCRDQFVLEGYSSSPSAANKSVAGNYE